MLSRRTKGSRCTFESPEAKRSEVVPDVQVNQRVLFDPEKVEEVDDVHGTWVEGGGWRMRPGGC